MLKIFSYLKNSKAMVLTIILLLVVQAGCDLSLPQYTSDIVDVGIQQGGIERATPEKMRKETYENLCLFMTEEEIQQVESYYSEDEEENYVLNTKDKDILDEMDSVLGMPMLIIASIEESGEMDINQIRQAVDAGMVSREEMVAKRDEVEASFGDMSESIIQQKAILLVKEEYEALGMNLDDIQMGYLKTKGIQMVEVMLLRMVFYAPIIGVGGIFKVLNTKTGMSWIIVVAVLTIMALVLILMTLAMPKFKKMQDLVDRLNLVSREILTGIPVIRAFSREKHEEQRFDVANTNLMRTQLFTNRVMTFMMPAMMFIMNGISVLIVWNGAHGINQGNLQVGDMMAFITYTMQIVMAFLLLTMISIMLPRAGVAAERIDEVLKTEPSIHDAAQVRDDELKDDRG